MQRRGLSLVVAPDRVSLSPYLRALLALPLLLACSKAPRADGTPDGQSLPPQADIVDACVTPNTGCACDEPGRVVNCGEVVARSDQYVSCSMGSRTCDSNGKWGTCVGQQVITLNTWQGPGVKTAAQPAGMPAPTACDPYLFKVSGDVTDYTPGGSVETVGGKVQLKSTSVAVTACPMGTMITITPSTAPTKDLVLTVVASPPTPNTVQFTASLPACAGAFTPIWTMDQPSYGSISSTGLLTLQYPYVGPINVTAYVGGLSSTVVSDVTVSAVDTSATGAAAVASQFLTTCTP